MVGAKVGFFVGTQEGETEGISEGNTKTGTPVGAFDENARPNSTNVTRIFNNELGKPLEQKIITRKDLDVKIIHLNDFSFCFL